MKRKTFLILSAGTIVGLTRWRLPVVAEPAVTAAPLTCAPISLAAYLRANPTLRAAWEKTVEPPLIPYLPTERELDLQERRRQRTA